MAALVGRGRLAALVVGGLGAMVSLAHCAASAGSPSAAAGPGVTPAALPGLLVGGPVPVPGTYTTYIYSPCPNQYFAPECASAIASTSTVTDTPPGSEMLFEFASPATAAAAQRAQQGLESSSAWPCGAPPSCAKAPMAATDVGVPVVSVSFTLGARGNLSEANDLATARKGRFLLNFSWISASTVSAGRAITPATVRAYLLEALAKLPG